MSNVPNTTLRGWKEIASHVGRDVRTVQRWERQRGFPVKRLPGADRGNVYALASELDAWLHPSHKAPLPADMEPAPEVGPEDAVPAERDPEAVPAAASGDRGPADRRVWRGAVGLGTLAAALAIVMGVFFRLHQGRAEARGAPAAPPRPYASPVAGVDALYLQSMYLFAKRTPESLGEAKRLLLDITARDPKDAPAWSGLAQTLTLRIEYGMERDPEPNEASAMDRARFAAERALALDPELAEPHAVLGFAEFFWNGKVQAAEPEFQTALRVNPGSAIAHSWYGTFLTYEARYPEALEQLNEAQHLEPSSTAILASRALAMGLSGHRDEGLQLLRQAGEENPIAVVRYDVSLLALVPPRMPDLYLKEELELAASEHSEVQVRLFQAAQEAYRRGGEPAMWRSFLTSYARERGGAEQAAEAHAALGENDDALADLAEEQRRSHRLVGILMDPRLLALHHDPRFQQIVRAEGLPSGS